MRIDAPRAVAQPADRFADLLCRQAGGTLPPVPAAADANTTDRTWRKDQLAAAVVAALDAARRGRLVWLLLENLNRCDTFDESTSELLFLLYERTLTEPWLRVLLDGMDGTLPRDVRGRTVTHRVAAVSEEDIYVCLQRRLTELGCLPNDLSGLIVMARSLYRRYQAADPVTAVADLAGELERVVSDFDNL